MALHLKRPRGQFIGQANRFRQAPATVTAQRPIHRRFQARAVAAGDEYRLDPGTRAQDRANHFLLMAQRCPRTPARGRGCILPHQARFCHPDGGQPADQAQVAGHTKPPRMGIAVAVAQQQIHGRQRRQGLQNSRRLAERQQPRYIGQAGRHARKRGGYRQQRLCVK